MPWARRVEPWDCCVGRVTKQPFSVAEDQWHGLLREQHHARRLGGRLEHMTVRHCFLPQHKSRRPMCSAPVCPCLPPTVWPLGRRIYRRIAMGSGLALAAHVALSKRARLQVKRQTCPPDSHPFAYRSPPPPLRVLCYSHPSTL